MAVRIQCPHCQSVFQLDERFLSAPIQCGRCRQAFTIQAPRPQAQASPPIPTAAPIAAAAAPLSKPGSPAAPPETPSAGNFWSEVRNFFTAPRPGEAAPPVATPAADDDNDVSLDWDAPGVSNRMATPATAPQAQPTAAAPASVAGGHRLEIGSATHPGRVRSHNEDSFLVQQLSWCNLDQRRDLALVVVADGVGGYQAGDQASGLLVRVAGNSMTPLLTGALTGQVKDVTLAKLTQSVDGAIRTANATIHQRAQSNAACKGMASTVAVVLIWDGQVVIGHVGDCRVYHYRQPQLTQVTRDQTLVNRMLDMGQLTPQQALNHPARNEVLQAVGRHGEVSPSGYQLRLAAGDWLIVACDGLHAHVDARMLEQAIRQAVSAGALANQLVELANKGGGSDNITVVALRCS